MGIRKFLFLASVLLSLIVYQHCGSSADFSGNNDDRSGLNGGSGNGGDGNNEGDGGAGDGDAQIASKNVTFNSATDILFVLDDSCSMGSITSNVQSGIDSVGSLNFAANTMMAVTYMSPVYLDNQGMPDFTSPYYGRALGTPGHMQLVTKATVDQFLNMTPRDQTDVNAQNRFQIEACNTEWFAPDSMNASSETCLSGAMQSPYYCTHSEAGALVMSQFVHKLTQESKTLFRSGANVHIVFVSDTHDAGVGNFYGRNSLPTQIPTSSELNAQILANNPQVQSIRYSGIVPLPVVGDPMLDNVNVIGDVPQNNGEANIGESNKNGYSYLNLIRDTQGVAMHAASTDWTQAMAELVAFTETPGSVLVQLQDPATEIESVKVNDVAIDASQYELKADKVTVEVSHNFQNGQSYEIKVAYKK